MARPKDNWLRSNEGQKLALFAENFAIHVVEDTDFAMPGLLRYKSPFIDRIDRRTKRWRALEIKDLKPTDYPWLDYSVGILYWPRLGNDPYQFLHEVGHIVAGTKRPNAEEEMGPTCAFEWMAVHWLAKATGIVSVPDWLAWRQGTGGESVADIAAAHRRYRNTIIKRGLFTKDGDPIHQEEWNQPAFVTKVYNAIERWG